MSLHVGMSFVVLWLSRDHEFLAALICRRLLIHGADSFSERVVRNAREHITRIIATSTTIITLKILFMRIALRGGQCSRFCFLIPCPSYLVAFLPYLMPLKAYVNIKNRPLYNVGGLLPPSVKHS